MAEPSDKPILVVDDDPMFGELVSHWLTDAGYPTLWLKTAEEALKRVETGTTPRAAVVDGLLPGMRGDELVLRLRKRFDPATLPVVFVSAFFRDLKSYRFLTRDCAVNSVLHKPITREDLLSTLSRFLAPKRLQTLELEIDIEPPSASGREPAPGPAPALDNNNVEPLRTLLDELSANASDAGRLNSAAERLRTAAHALKLPDLARLADTLQSLLTEGPPESPAQRARLSGIVEALSRKIGRLSGHNPIAVSADPGFTPTLALLDGNTALAACCRAAAGDGRPVRVFATLDELLEAIRSPLGSAAVWRPDVVFLAEDAPNLDAARACQRLRASGVQPVVVLSRSDSLPHLIGLIDAGADARLPRVCDLEGLLRVARPLVRRHTGTSLVALDSDAVFLGQLAEILAGQQVVVHPCSKPQDVFNALESDEASLVLLDLDSAAWAGMSVLRALRAEATRRRVPVLALSTQVDPAEAFAAGADDFLRRPFAREELIARALRLIGRDLQLRRDSQTDHLTGLLVRSAFLHVAERSIALARRSGRTVAILVFDFDAEGIANSYGHGALSEVVLAVAAHLGSAFRSSDIATRLGPGRFGVLLHDAHLFDAHGLLESTLRLLRHARYGAEPQAFSVAVRGGMAGFPEVADGAEALLRAAESSSPRS